MGISRDETLKMNNMLIKLNNSINRLDPLISLKFLVKNSKTTDYGYILCSSRYI